MKIDFHIHTKYSPDSLTQPRDLAAKAKKLGIIPTVTDHNSIEAHNEMRSLGADFIPGEEISTDKGDLVALHINERIPKRIPFLEAIDNIHEQGGIAYLPHMYDHARSGAHVSDDEAKKVDVIEVFNARCLNPNFNHLAESFASRNKMLKAVGSDSHFLFEFGYNYNEFPDFDFNDPKALLKALKKVKFVTKKGPIYARGTTRFIYMGKKLLKII
ncbi:PHP-associated [Candidatus Bilamarchaeum dharawalense]|uniref:PHP-associated n=1 Tax=Candidatus Bilamarchaeum dharawalense TaxID=2885759 RepID=A0A5E4LT54_9ARCH|nr:PHP-associated [Candidatus Bilamarchaeum dharawalense]